jgi:hypothetical protein
LDESTERLERLRKITDPEHEENKKFFVNGGNAV